MKKVSWPKEAQDNNKPRIIPLQKKTIYDSVTSIYKHFPSVCDGLW